MAGTASVQVEGKVFAAQQGDDGVEGGGPVFFGGLRVVAERLDVEADGEALLRAGEVDERRAETQSSIA